LGWITLETRTLELAAYDYGGEGEAVLLLHGLAGHAREWDETASWLTSTHKVIAPEQRGQGRSERLPVDMSRDAFVDDVVAWIDLFALHRVILVGQSLGGHTAFVTAARYRSRVAGLVVVEASPVPDPTSVDVVRDWLDAWPTPFASRKEALAYFGGEGLWAEAWTAGLEEGPDGLLAAFDTERLLAALADAEARPYWPEWSRISCPTLVVRADGGLSADIGQEMVESNEHARLVTISDAGHDVHLEQPDAWREALTSFLTRL
jgi:pimeloyl-ACP methyl ester carboxylesterase